MPSPAEKLLKFLKLESERGYDNRAVVGGLDKILPSWEEEARSFNLPEEQIQKICEQLRAYPGRDLTERQQTVKELISQIQSMPGYPKTAPQPNTAPLSDPKSAHTTPPPPAAPRPVSQARKNLPPVPSGLNADLTVLPGIGPKTAQTLQHLGLRTLEDLLYYFPRRYDDYSRMKTINRLEYGDELSVIGMVKSAINRTVRGGKMTVFEAVISDKTGGLRVSWFNQPWLERAIQPGAQIVVSGKVDMYLGRLTMNNPDWELLEQEHLHTSRIVPVYPLTAKVTQKNLRRLMHQTVSFWAPRVTDHLPPGIVAEAGVMPLPEALLQVHFPDNHERLKDARDRLAFDEIFLLQLGVLRQKRSWQSLTAAIFDTPPEWLEEQKARLPYPLTNAQLNVLEHISADLRSGQPMNRLLQGDVGSGKTVVAALAIAMVARHGVQSALMAPTSILAEQHYRNLLKLLSAEGDPTAPLRESEICLLIGATPEAQKQEIRAGLADGSVKLVIGTHALLEDPVEFQSLQLVIIDEQHRFGVEQRATLRRKGQNPHLLVMTATPIPRSLALTLYGDLDVSIIDEMPPGRQPVETHIVPPLERERVYAFARSQIEQGRQVFIVYPLVEQGDNGDVLAAVEEQERLQTEVFPKHRVGLLHGRMKAEEKDQIMTAFRDGEYDILVSTSVIEVGVDIPNATVMLIEGANRFGLSQLHQFRGRVGRGDAKSYCILIPDNEDALENQHLAVMAETNDGFVLAERDLEQRGPGDFLGTRQAGFSELRMANLLNIRLIEKARRLAQNLFDLDPDLSAPEHRPLLQAMRRFWGEGAGDIS
jgi:ATP-dependent DNA helicase RecG